MSSIMRRRNGLIASSVMGMLLSLGESCEPLISRQHAPSRYRVGSVAGRGELPRERFSRVPGMLNSSEVKVFHPT
jgi:hypothetical protein